MSDGSVLEGTSEPIMEAMQYSAFGQQTRTRGEYIDWLVGQVERLEQIVLCVEGDTRWEKAMSLVAAMLWAGPAEKV